MASRMDINIRKINRTPKVCNYNGILDSSDGRKANVSNMNDAEIRDVYCMMPYGIASRAKKGSKTQIIINGNNHNSMIGVYDPKRPKVKTGEIMLYSNGGAKIYLKDNGDIEITGSHVKVNGREL